jgi:hypothetical protein
MHYEWTEIKLFSVRETLLGHGNPEYRFYRSLIEAKRFIDATSITSLMDLMFNMMMPYPILRLPPVRTVNRNRD